jgi:hypothetical protein
LENAKEIATARRRFILDMARRRQKPGSGSQPWIRDGHYKLNWPDLRDVLSGIPWAVVGAVATRLYMAERATVGLDILILPTDADEVAPRLESAGYQLVGPLTIGGKTWRSPQGVAVDVIEGREAWQPPALKEAAGNLDASGTPALPLSYLVLMKTLSSRSQDIADVVRMLGNAGDEQLDEVRSVIARWSADLLADLEGMIVQGKLETGC